MPTIKVTGKMEKGGEGLEKKLPPHSTLFKTNSLKIYKKVDYSVVLENFSVCDFVNMFICY